LEIAGQTLLATVSLFPAFLYFGIPENLFLTKTSFLKFSKLIMLGARAQTSCRELEVWRYCWTNVVGHSKFISSLFVLWDSRKSVFDQNIIFESSKLLMLGAEEI
jgi:hypothetical protein